MFGVPDKGRGPPPVPVGEDLLQVVYDKRPVATLPLDFEALRKRAAAEWAATPRKADNISPELRAATQEVAKALHIAAGVANSLQ